MFIVAILALSACVWANTESVIVVHKTNLCEGQLSNTAAPYASIFDFSHERLAFEQLCLLEPEGTYWVRVCWPASYPADVSIEFDKHRNSIVVSGSREDVVIFDNARSKTFVPFEVHVSRLKWGILPEVLLPMISGITAAFGFGCLVAYVFVKRCL